MPSTYRAVMLTKKGGPEVLRIVDLPLGKGKGKRGQPVLLNYFSKSADDAGNVPSVPGILELAGSPLFG